MFSKYISFNSFNISKKEIINIKVLHYLIKKNSNLLSSFKKNYKYSFSKDENVLGAGVLTKKISYGTFDLICDIFIEHKIRDLETGDRIYANIGNSIINEIKFNFIGSNLFSSNIKSVFIFFLTLFGIIMVSSVSLPLTEGSFSLIISHISKVIISLIIFLLIFRFPINFWSKVDIQILLIAFFLLFLVFAPIIGQEVNGANRWIRVFGFSIQPSELMKFALIIYISSYCSRRLDEFKEKWLGFWKPILVVVMAISLVLFEPDLGSSAVIFVVALSIMFIAGAPLRHLFVIFSLGMSVFILMILTVPWRMKRILSFMNPWDTYQN